jgi:hypothetical protein
MEKHQFKLLIAACACLLSLSLVLLLLVILQRQPSLPAAILELSLPNPAPSATTVFTGISADGKVNLQLTKTPQDTDSNWELTSRLTDQPAQTIWTATLSAATIVSLPFNTVSPDNKYLFLKQADAGQTAYLVMKTDGQAPVDFFPLFTEQFPEYRIKEATGWGGINLIVFNTLAEKDTPGPSFWFEVPSRSFIRLSGRF